MPVFAPKISKSCCCWERTKQWRPILRQRPYVSRSFFNSLSVGCRTSFLATHLWLSETQQNKYKGSYAVLQVEHEIRSCSEDVTFDELPPPIRMPMGEMLAVHRTYPAIWRGEEESNRQLEESIGWKEISDEGHKLMEQKSTFVDWLHPRHVFWWFDSPVQVFD